jgi:2-dehydropantoate 2-reductase
MTYRAAVAQRDAGASVLVAGAGAIGSVFGGLLAHAGRRVVLLGRPAHVAAIGRHGLRIDGLFGEHLVRGLEVATDPASLRGPFATILLTVKSYDTAAVTQAVAPCLAADGRILTLQNGLGNLEQVASVVGPGRVIGARVIFGAELAAPGHVRVTVNAQPVAVGTLDPADVEGARAAAGWANAFDDAGIPSVPTDNLPGELWAKVFYNAALNPLGALLGVPYGYLSGDADARTIMDTAIDEAFAVARASGVRLAWADAAGYRARFYDTLVPSTAAHRSSMLQDLERGRPTEIEAINGYVARRGTALGVAVPTNTMLTHLIRARVRRAQRGEGPWTH